MEIAGYIASILIGVSLGLIGAGGGILTVPVMVYLFHVPVLMASSYSLFLVGTTSLLGACQQMKLGNVNQRMVVLFCAVSLLVVAVLRQVVIPAIPEELFHFQGISITTSMVNMVLFAFLMIVAAYAMIRKRTLATPPRHSGRNLFRVVLCGALVGLVTGLLGAGGGFLLIPSLVLLLGLSMKDAVGTSLLIIAVNSLIGFSLDLQHFAIEWKFLGTVTLIATAGIFIGVAIGRKVSSKKLKIVFGWFVMILGIIILSKEALSLFDKIYEHHQIVEMIKLK